MRAVDKISIMNKISAELSKRYDYSDIDIFLNSFGILGEHDSFNLTTQQYAKQNITNTTDDTLIRIAKELDLSIPSNLNIISDLPKNWQNTKGIKTFISHISAKKIDATRLKECLSIYNFDCFA